MKASAAVKTVLAAALSGCLVCGCSGRAGTKEFNPRESSIYVKEDGTVSSASVEKTDRDYYSQEDLTAFVQERVDEFNQLQEGKSQDSASVQVASCSIENGEGLSLVKCILDYDSPQSLLAFNNSIRNPEIGFTELTTDSVSALSQEDSFGQAAFMDVKGSGVELSKVTEKGNLRAVRLNGSSLVHTEGKVLYMTQGCVLEEEEAVRTPQEGVSYIIFE